MLDIGPEYSFFFQVYHIRVNVHVPALRNISFLNQTHVLKISTMLLLIMVITLHLIAYLSLNAASHLTGRLLIIIKVFCCVSSAGLL